MNIIMCCLFPYNVIALLPNSACISISHLPTLASMEHIIMSHYENRTMSFGDTEVKHYRKGYHAMEENNIILSP